ncbi:hypothetical protein NQ176_g10726 [Zarea fungicola]|uniref:Uncharacterized protein n=1 Tax=Zarea fungicola TaxID=93591 RepID=A0ACC1MEV2_9HYPO|nr:hypothetical protein NQ176_g10726 [Lecanicillium fungicola]
MDHTGHMDHGGGGMDDMCSMSMLFTWDTNNLCIVFKQWHIRSTPGLIISLIAVVLIAMGYEGLRAMSRTYEKSIASRVDTAPRQNHDQITRRSHLIKSLLYGLQNFYAFMLISLYPRRTLSGVFYKLPITLCNHNDIGISKTWIVLYLWRLPIRDARRIHHDTAGHTPYFEAALKVDILLGRVICVHNAAAVAIQRPRYLLVVDGHVKVVYAPSDVFPVNPGAVIPVARGQTVARLRRQVA